MDGKIKPIFLFFFEVFCCFFILLFSLEVLSYSLQLNEYNKKARSITEGPFFLCDAYDSKDSSMTSFFDGNNSYDIILNAYKNVSNSARLNYYEYSEQPIELYTHFQGDEKFCPDSSPELLNQDYGDDTITALKAIQIGERFYHDFNLKEKTEKKTSLTFNCRYNDTIPIIAGSAYKEYLNEGDCISAVFLGETVRIRVIDFFKTESKYHLGDTTNDLDYTLIMPMLAIDQNTSSRRNKILLSVKAEGFIMVDSERDYVQQISELERIKRKTGFLYYIPLLPRDNHNILGINMWQSLMLFILGLVLFFNCFPKCINISKTITICRMRLVIAVLIVIAVISYCLNRIVFYDYQETIKDSCMWTVILLMLFITYSVHILHHNDQ